MQTHTHRFLLDNVVTFAFLSHSNSHYGIIDTGVLQFVWISKDLLIFNHWNFSLFCFNCIDNEKNSTKLLIWLQSQMEEFYTRIWANLCSIDMNFIVTTIIFNWNSINEFHAYMLLELLIYNGNFVWLS